MMILHYHFDLILTFQIYPLFIYLSLPLLLISIQDFNNILKGNLIHNHFAVFTINIELINRNFYFYKIIFIQVVSNIYSITSLDANWRIYEIFLSESAISFFMVIKTGVMSVQLIFERLTH
jgi:hypothetical protein